MLVGALVAMGLAAQMSEVAIGWQVYGIHRRALDLGLIGLAEFVPLLLLALPAGHIADRLPRRRVFTASLVVYAAVTACLIAVTAAGARSLWPFLVLAAANGAAGAVGNPAPVRCRRRSSRPSSCRRPSRCARSQSGPARSSARRSAGCSSRCGPSSCT
jgi:MFS family permease